MHRLRRKLESDSHHPHYIRTERGIGYVFTIRPAEATNSRPDEEAE
jgi:DNA-binding response OmpR family regulator